MHIALKIAKISLRNNTRGLKNSTKYNEKYKYNKCIN